MSDHERELFKALEESRQFIAVMTGIKAQFIEAGWTPEGAERMTELMLQKGGQA